MRKPLALLVAATGAACLTGCARFESRPLSAVETAARFEDRSLADPGLRVYLEKQLGHPLPSWPLNKWDYPTLTLVAFYFSPDLQVALAQANVADAAGKTAAGRPNPTVSVQPGYDFNPAAGANPWIPLGTLDVPIETAGKRGYRMATASHLSQAARLRVLGVAWQVRSALGAGLLEYASTRQRAELLGKQLALQERVLQLLQERFEAGAVARSELTPMRLTMARTSSDLAEAARQAAAARVRVAESLGLPARAIEKADLDFPLDVDAEAGKELTSVEARQQALLGRSDILASLADYAASQTALQLEIAKQYPDLHLGNIYQFDQGEHKWNIGLTFDLPILNRNQGPIEEAKAKREEAAARFLALQSSVISMIDLALATRTASLDQLTRQEQLTRLARESLTSSQALFDAGALDNLDLSNAQVEASAAQLSYLEAQVRARQAVAQLEEAIQRPLLGWPDFMGGQARAQHQP